MIYKTDTENICSKGSAMPSSSTQLWKKQYEMQTSGLFIMQSADQSQARTTGIILVMLVCYVSFFLPASEKRAVWILLSEIKLARIKLAWRMFWYWLKGVEMDDYCRSAPIGLMLHFGVSHDSISYKKSFSFSGTTRQFSRRKHTSIHYSQQ